MRTAKQLVVFTTLIAFIGAPSFGADSNKKNKSDQVSTSQSQVTTERYQSAYPQWGLGISSADNIIPVAVAASFWLAFNQDSALQGYFGILATSPFTFGVGALYKHTVAGGNYAGLHLGGGLGLGTVQGVFNLNIDAVVGFHFFLPSLKNILVNVDFGPSLNILDGATNFKVGGLGTILGLSIHYIF